MHRLTGHKLQDMVAVLKHKSANGFSLLYDNYATVLLGVICQITKHTTIADDILQEIFIKIWHNIDTYNIEKELFYLVDEHYA